tara:strand:+ start:1478 stop:1630 length:153 start_codon:yes stop_codon:yes gene_type:complete
MWEILQLIAGALAFLALSIRAFFYIINSRAKHELDSNRRKSSHISSDRND